MEEIEKGISYSEIYSYQACPRKHQYSYIERLHKTSYSQSSRMNIGIVVHLCIEACLNEYHKNYEQTLEIMKEVIWANALNYSVEYKPQPNFIFTEDGSINANADELKQWDEDIELAMKIAYRTIEHLDIPNHWRTVEYNGIPLIEYRFEYPIFSDRNLIGKIDWVAKNLDDGQVYLIDWKTRKIFTDDFEVGAEDMNLQMSLYQYVLNSLGVDIFGTITYQIKSIIPSIPEITKSGKVSKAKIATDLKTFVKAVEDNGENPDDYEEMVDKLPGDEYWWLPIYVIRGQRELYERWKNTQNVVERMVNDTLAPKYESPQCAYCPYFRLCLSEDRGLDIEATKGVYYTNTREEKINATNE